MRRVQCAVITAALLLACVEASAQASAPLRFCTAQHNLPMSAAHPPSGVELEVAQAIARKLGTRAEFVWRESDAEGIEQGVLEGRCDAALGVMAETSGIAAGPPLPGVARTRPYYGAGYVLIHRPASRTVETLAELGDTRIAVETESVPIYTLKQRGHKVHALFDYDGVIAAVSDGRAEYGYLWGPAVARLLRDRKDVVIAPGFRPDDRWNFALAVREDSLQLRQKLNEAIQAVVREGTVAGIFARHRVPYLPPQDQE